ncbi:sugar transferase [bacterium]|nr:sugar transferase [bacterium]
MPRFLEILIALAGLVLLSPLFVLAAVLIPLESKGPVFYKADRVGRGGRTFVIWKFRSMIVNADKDGPAITTRRDSRVTAVGAFLRRTKLDELPQLINVLKGDMGFVGPRPEDPRIVSKYNDFQKEILLFRPGITSPASITFRSEEGMVPSDDWEKAYFNHILPRKLEMDLAYMKQATFSTDLNVMFQTIFNYNKNNI